MSKDKPLTPKQERFCEEYLVDLNGTQAMLRAGYKMNEKSAATEAHKLLRKPNICARIQELRNKQSERTKISADYVLSTIQEVVERCMQRAPVMVRRGKSMVQLKDEDGNNVWRFDAMGANNALAMLGKHLKLFADRVEHSGPDGKPIEHKDVSELTDAQLDARIDEFFQKAKGAPK